MQLIHGDCIKVMENLRGGVFDAVITDPPYSSGGTEWKSVAAPTAAKYTSIKRDNPLPDFDGEKFDSFIWLRFMTDVFTTARAITAQGGIICTLCDWRRIAATEEALMRANWNIKGVAVWDKTQGVRPQKGRYRQQAEFIMWGTNGANIRSSGQTLPGVFTHANVAHDKLHQVQKPQGLMRDVLQIVAPGGRVLDPFCGSGTTLLAARELGLDAVGIESNAQICQTAAQRLGIEVTEVTEICEGRCEHD